MAEFPTALQDITPAWLTEAVQSAGVSDGRVVGFDAEQIGAGVGIMGLLYRLHLRYANGVGGPSTLVVKVPSPHEGTRHVAKTFRFYEKEVKFYRDLAHHTPLGTTPVVRGEWDENSDDFVLLMHDVVGRTVYDQTVGCPPDVAEVAVRALARHHAAFAESPLFDQPEHAWLPFGADAPIPEGVAQGVAEAWDPFVERFAADIPDDLLAIGQAFPANARSLLEQPDGHPTTLAHGDYRLDNLFFGADDSVLALDWQIAAKAPCGYDLAYFITQSMTTEDRRAHEDKLIAAYLEELAAAGLEHDPDRLMLEYRRTTMFCIAYPIQGGGTAELVNDRAYELMRDMANRALQAIRDHDATEFLS